MDKFLVTGGKSLEGVINVPKAKNSYLALLSACVLCIGEVTLKDCPMFSDINKMLEILSRLGAKVKREGKDVIIDARSVSSYEVPKVLAHQVRSSIFLLGPIIGRLHKARVSYPGGCDIGLRPIDLHLKGLRALNVDIQEKYGEINCECDKLIGNDIHLDYPSVGATENIMMAGVYAKGVTRIYNPAKEPEIVDLKTIYPFLNADETVILDKLRRGKRKYDYSEYAILSEPAKKAAEDLTKFALEPAEENLYYSKLLKSYLDDKFGEKKYVFVSIGRSPSTIARCMEKLAVKTVYCPISCFRMKQLPLITNVSGFSNYSNYLAKHGLNKQNLEQSGKTWVFYDYTESGDSLLAYKNLMTQHFSLPLNKTDFRSLNEDLILIAPEYKKVIDFAGRFFALSLSHKFGGVPELPWQDVGLINRVKLTNKNLLGFNCYKFALQNLIEKEKKI